MPEKTSPRLPIPYHISAKSGVSPIEAGYGLVHADTIVATTNDELRVTPGDARFELTANGKTTTDSVATLGLDAGQHNGELRVIRDQAVLAEKKVSLILVDPSRVCRRFGARYGALEYDLSVVTGVTLWHGTLIKTPWSSLWKTGEVADIVVDFEAPYKFVLWRGMAYAPSWALANVMTSNFFAETLEPRVFRDCCEMMSDRECRYSHARVIQTSDARVVIHWRYALNDPAYTICRNQWADEMLYIYPDGVAVRNVTIYLDPHDETAWRVCPRTGRRLPVPMMMGEAGKRSFNDMEFITVNPTGASAEDVTPADAFTMLDGHTFSRTYRWPKPPDFAREPLPELGEYIFRMNYRNRPGVFVASPSAEMNLRLEANDRAVRYVAAARVEEDSWVKEPNIPSDFITCVHWPVTRAFGTTPLSDSAQYQNGPTHTFLGYAENAPVEVREDGACAWTWLCGMAPEADSDLRDIARSWLYPPPIEGARYESRERAYHISGRTENPLTIGGNYPLVNPTFILPFAAREPVAVSSDGIQLEAHRIGTGIERTLHREQTVITCRGTFLPGNRVRIMAEGQGQL